MSIKYSEQSRIFRDFRSIPYSDYYYLIRFYEQNNKDISFLPLDEGMIMSYYYANALFETQEYELHINVANDLLEQSIVHNIRYIDGEDVYMTVLYKKANAHLRLGQVETAERLATQLLRLEPQQFHYQALLRQCFLLRRPYWLRPTLTISAIATLMGAFTTIMLFSFRNALETSNKMLVVPYSLLAFATLGLLATALGYYKYVISPSKDILHDAQAYKATALKEQEVEVQ
jgi:tetratricopeptide (TPR) repeat protein